MPAIRVLYIEDEEALASLVHQLVSRTRGGKYRFSWARDLAKGLKLLASERPDLVLLDLNLPDSQGLETLDMVLKARPEAAVVVLTGQSEPYLYQQALQRGAQDYLEKQEVRPRLLERVLGYALERKQHEQALREANQALDARVRQRTQELERINLLLREEADERCRVQMALTHSEEQSRLFLHSLPVATVVYDSQGRVLFVNKAFEDLFGWKSQELLGNTLDFVPSEEQGELASRVQTLKEGRPVPPWETVRLDSQGQRRQVVVSAAPHLDPGGKTSGATVVLRDISERKQLEQAKWESERRFRDLVESISEGLMELDGQARLSYANSRLSQMLGYSRQELLDMTVFDLVDPEQLPAFRAQWEGRRRGQPGKYEIAWRRKDRQRMDCLISATPRHDSQGSFLGSLSLVTDITERKLMESQLLQSQKLEAIGQLAAGIAHEINTPTQYVSDNTRFFQQAAQDVLGLVAHYQELLASLKAQGLFPERITELEELAQEIDLDYLVAEVPVAMSQTVEGLEHISKIVRSMKEFAHPGPEGKTPTDLNRAIENTITVARNEWKYVAEMHTDLDPDLPTVECNPGQFNQVVLNLLVNAAQALGEAMESQGRPKGHITVKTRKDGDWAEIRVSDDGPGVPQALQARVFEPFFTTKEPGKGTGQGLAIAHTAIVKNQQGTISLESAPGQGATFIIRLPLGGQH